MATETETLNNKILFDSTEILNDYSSVSVRITVPGSEAKKVYDGLLDKYVKQARIKGFRAGKAPREVIERKIGEILKGEAKAEVIEKCFEQQFEKTKYKPLAYSVPRLEGDLVFEPGKDFELAYNYDILPSVELGKYKDLDAEQPIVIIGEDDVDRELGILAEQNAVIVAKEGKACSGDICTIDYAELDEGGNEIAKTKRESFTFTIGSGYNLYKIDDDIIGLGKDEEKTIAKEYPSDFEFKDLAGRSVSLKVKLTSLKEKKLPALDDELAQDISEKYKTLGDLKEDIKSRLEEHAKRRVREKTIASLIEKIVLLSKFSGLPRSMLARELEIKWRSFIRSYRSNEKLIIAELEKGGKSKESVLEEWKPRVEEGLKSQLVVEHMIEKEKIHVTDEEVDSFIRNDAAQHGVDFEEAKKHYGAAGQGNVRFVLSKEKLFDLLLENTRIKKGSGIKYLDFMKEND